MPNPSPADIRRDYSRFELHEKDVSPDPIEQFRRWFADAETAKVAEPNAMTLATADRDGRPDARIVLLKGIDTGGFVFYTNKASTKGSQLRENPRATLVFFWQELERQVRIDGKITDVSREEAELYFHSRPVGSQIGAWVSHQSSILSSRDELDAREKEMNQKFAGQPVPMPDYWGGYRLIPQTLEFWQGRPSRLHDRLRYTRVDTAWKLERLSP